MPRLLRPHIPLEVRCRVVLRQLGEMWPDGYMRARRSSGQSFRNILRNALGRFAELLACEVKDLHLDHHPALGAREKVMRKGQHVGYKPDANDPEFLIYREKHAHHIKTNVRGEGAQHPDRVLIKKERRREKNRSTPTKPPRKVSCAKWGSRPMAKGKSQWPRGRKIESRSSWR